MRENCFQTPIGGCLLLAVAVLLAACGDKKWDARPLDRSVALELNGVPLTIALPDGLEQSDQSERQVIFGTEHLDDPADADGVWPNLTVRVYEGELPRTPSHIAIPADTDADHITEFGPDHVRVRFDGATTLSETHFRTLPSRDAYIECGVVLYGGMNGVAADHERRRLWMHQLCEGVRPR